MSRIKNNYSSRIISSSLPNYAISLVAAGESPHVYLQLIAVPQRTDHKDESEAKFLRELIWFVPCDTSIQCVYVANFDTTDNQHIVFVATKMRVFILWVDVSKAYDRINIDCINELRYSNIGGTSSIDHRKSINAVSMASVPLRCKRSNSATGAFDSNQTSDLCCLLAIEGQIVAIWPKKSSANNSLGSIIHEEPQQVIANVQIMSEYGKTFDSLLNSSYFILEMIPILSINSTFVDAIDLCLLYECGTSGHRTMRYGRLDSKDLSVGKVSKLRQSVESDKSGPVNWQLEIKWEVNYVSDAPISLATATLSTNTQVLLVAHHKYITIYNSSGPMLHWMLVGQEFIRVSGSNEIRIEADVRAPLSSYEGTIVSICTLNDEERSSCSIFICVESGRITKALLSSSESLQLADFIISDTQATVGNYFCNLFPMCLHAEYNLYFVGIDSRGVVSICQLICAPDSHDQKYLLEPHVRCNVSRYPRIANIVEFLPLRSDLCTIPQSCVVRSQSHNGNNCLYLCNRDPVQLPSSRRVEIDMDPVWAFSVRIMAVQLSIEKQLGGIGHAIILCVPGARVSSLILLNEVDSSIVGGGLAGGIIVEDEGTVLWQKLAFPASGFLNSPRAGIKSDIDVVWPSIGVQTCSKSISLVDIDSLASIPSTTQRSVSKRFGHIELQLNCCVTLCSIAFPFIVVACGKESTGLEIPAGRQLKGPSGAGAVLLYEIYDSRAPVGPQTAMMDMGLVKSHTIPLSSGSSLPIAISICRSGSCNQWMLGVLRESSTQIAFYLVHPTTREDRNSGVRYSVSAVHRITMQPLSTSNFDFSLSHFWTQILLFHDGTTPGGHYSCLIVDIEGVIMSFLISNENSSWSSIAKGQERCGEGIIGIHSLTWSENENSSPLLFLSGFKDNYIVSWALGGDIQLNRIRRSYQAEAQLSSCFHVHDDSDLFLYSTNSVESKMYVCVTNITSWKKKIPEEHITRIRNLNSADDDGNFRSVKSVELKGRVVSTIILNTSNSASIIVLLEKEYDKAALLVFDADTFHLRGIFESSSSLSRGPLADCLVSGLLALSCRIPASFVGSKLSAASAEAFVLIMPESPIAGGDRIRCSIRFYCLLDKGSVEQIAHLTSRVFVDAKLSMASDEGCGLVHLANLTLEDKELFLVQAAPSHQSNCSIEDDGPVILFYGARDENGHFVVGTVGWCIADNGQRDLKELGSCNLPYDPALAVELHVSVATGGSWITVSVALTGLEVLSWLNDTIQRYFLVAMPQYLLSNISLNFDQLTSVSGSFSFMAIDRVSGELITMMANVVDSMAAATSAEVGISSEGGIRNTVNRLLRSTKVPPCILNETCYIDCAKRYAISATGAIIEL